jgi:hypothetical protein
MGEKIVAQTSDDPKLWADWKNKFRFSWSAVEDLGRESLVPARTLTKTLEDELAVSLNETWEQIIASLATRNPHARFKDFLRVPESAELITVYQPLAASGVFMK